MKEPLVIGRYMVFDEIGAGGMATVHLGRVLGAAGFSRVVAIKRLHPDSADKLATMLIDEARIAARIRHPNVVPMLDVARVGDELLLVMEYVHGPSLSWLESNLMLRHETMPPAIAARIIVDALHGLHAAHHAKSERGRPLEIVHRDISPQNILVGDDGVARVVDFGIAKAEGRLSFTQYGEIKGKLSYMSPEQLRAAPVDLRTDVFAVGVVYWELLTGRKLFPRPTGGLPFFEVVKEILSTRIVPPSQFVSVNSSVDAVVMQALSASPEMRFSTAEAMATAVMDSGDVATTKELGQWIGRIAGPLLAHRLEMVERMEQVSAIVSPKQDTTPDDQRRIATVTSPAAEAEPAPMTWRTSTMPMHSEPPPTLSVVERPFAVATAPLPPIPDPVRPAPMESTIISASREEPVKPPPSKQRSYIPLVLGVGATMLLVGVAGGMLTSRRGPATPTAPNVTSAPSSIATPAVSTSPVSAALVADGGLASDSFDPPPKRKRKGRAQPPRPSCDPPFRVDSDGIRVPIPECVNP